MKKILYIFYSLIFCCAIFSIGYLLQIKISPDEVKKAFIEENQWLSRFDEEIVLCAMNKNFNPDELVFLGLQGGTNPHLNTVGLHGTVLGKMTDSPGDIILFADGKKYVISPVETNLSSTFPTNGLDNILILIKEKWNTLKKKRSMRIYEKYIHSVYFEIKLDKWKHIRQCREITIKMDKQNAKEVNMEIAVLPELGTYMPKSALSEKYIKLQQKVPFFDVVIGGTVEAGGLNYLRKNYDMQVEEIRKKYSSTSPIRIEDKK